MERAFIKFNGFRGRQTERRQQKGKEAEPPEQRNKWNDSFLWARKEICYAYLIRYNRPEWRWLKFAGAAARFVEFGLIANRRSGQRESVPEFSNLIGCLTHEMYFDLDPRFGDRFSENFKV